MNEVSMDLTVNGEARNATADVRVTLADFLREQLGLTGTHLGCEHGVCGACTVLVDGVAVRSCLMLAVQARGHDVVTVEGLADGETLHPVQEAFWESHGFQCGFCTPGFVMTTVALLRENPEADEAEIRETLSGNVCRCTGYQSIVEGVLLAARKVREEGVTLLASGARSQRRARERQRAARRWGPGAQPPATTL